MVSSAALYLYRADYLTDDTENCPAPAGWSGCQLVKRIRDLVHQYGPIKLFKAYLSIAEQSQLVKNTALRSELQASGVSLTDSPHNGRKDVADKMMIGANPRPR